MIRFLRGLLALALPVLLVLLAVRIVMSPAWLFITYTRPDFPPDPYGLTVQDRLLYGLSGVDYLVMQHPIAFLESLRLPAHQCITLSENATDCPAFAPDELVHMQDVEQVTTTAFRAALVLAGAALVSALVLRRLAPAPFYAAVRDAGMLTLGIVAALVLAAVVAWDRFFDQFHALFFAPGTWQFDYSQTLIRLYPQQFWFEAVLWIGGLVTLGAAGLVVWGLSWRGGPDA